ncbi:MAG TPA: hypothetical protein VFG59_06225 [Anaeromyxobacter sp.]|nr:hypothetical protein [Anaeromyxobacter sp.]
MNRVVAGLAAGAAGTAALNAVTYGDMLLRGRAASEVPARTAEALTGRMGVRFPGGDRSRHRMEASGALMGMVAGMGTGVLYGALRRRRSAPLVLRALSLCGPAMLAADAPPVFLRVTDPRRWHPSGWLADLVPHLVYGLVTATVFEALWRRRRAPSVSGVLARLRAAN